MPAEVPIDMATLLVGDTVIGNALANSYGITRQGYTLTVTNVGGNMFSGRSQTVDRSSFEGLDPTKFNLVTKTIADKNRPKRAVVSVELNDVPF